MVAPTRLVLKTSKGIIVVRHANRGQWSLIELALHETEDTKRLILNVIRRKTGLQLYTSSVGAVRDSVDATGTYAVVWVDDIPMMSQIQTKGEDGTQVKEALYWEVENGKSILMPVRDFLKRNRLHTPP